MRDRSERRIGDRSERQIGDRRQLGDKRRQSVTLSETDERHYRRRGRRRVGNGVGDGVGDGSEMGSETGSEMGSEMGSETGTEPGTGRRKVWVLKPRVTCHVFRDKLSRSGTKGRRRICRSLGALLETKGIQMHAFFFRVQGWKVVETAEECRRQGVTLFFRDRDKE